MNTSLKVSTCLVSSGRFMKLALGVLLILMAIGCKKTKPVVDNGNNNNNNNNPTPQLYEYSVTPSVTSPAINTFNNDHYVMLDTRTTLKNKLFIFLPGTTGFPSVYKLIIKKASSLGYHSIGLMYPNNSDLYTAAAASSDNSQFAKCRQEIFDGTDQSSGVAVNSDNCIKNRLLKLLQYLDQKDTSQHWNQFLLNGNIDWSKIVIAGHSQGGGHALYISKQVSVDRAISFSSIDWNSNLNRSADWVTVPGATPVGKLYSFNNINDQIFAYANVQTQLADMGLTGPATNIENNTKPYNNSHTLTTSTAAAISVLFPDHNMTCLDQYIPKTGTGEVISTIQSAWEYLLGQ